MKRRNAETGKMRRPLKRTKISEGMYGNSLLYLKFVMLWATVVMADYMLDFKFEFLWPFWMTLRSINDSFKYQGFAFSIFFICIALTSDVICLLFMPIPWMFIAASTYVWIQCVWYTVADKGVCVPTVALCCFIVYVEGVLRVADRNGGLDTAGMELCRPLAAHCVGYPVVTLGFSFKSYVGHRIRLRRQMRVRAENEYLYQLMRDALPESLLEQSTQDVKNPQSKDSKESEKVPMGNGVSEPSKGENHTEHKHMNGSAVNAKSKKCAAKIESNGLCNHEHSALQLKLEKLERHLQASSERNERCALSNGAVPSDAAEDDGSKDGKGSAKYSKCDKKENSLLKEDKKKNKNRDKDKDKELVDSHKSTEHAKEPIVKEVESTKDSVKSTKESNHINKEKEKEKDKERERDREHREGREWQEELKRVRSELAAARVSEAEAKRALAASAAAERQRRADHAQLARQHTQLQHKLSTWRGTERAALERRLAEERRARTVAEQQLLKAQTAAKRASTECENEVCKSSRSSQEAELTSLRRELQRFRDRAQRSQRDLANATQQLRSLETRAEEARSSSPNSRLYSACAALQDRNSHLERSLSAETRVKLDLLSALGEAKRQLTIREGIVAKQDKEIEELKAQMLALMPNSYGSSASAVTNASHLRRPDGSPLDPNASCYTPKQLCSDA